MITKLEEWRAITKNFLEQFLPSHPLVVSLIQACNRVEQLEEELQIQKNRAINWADDCAIKARRIEELDAFISTKKGTP